MDVKFVDTTEWQETFWLQSGGTREKRILQDHNDNSWYFKRSERKPGWGDVPDKYYKDEFWSEIIAYQIGRMLGLNILRYDVALSNSQIGCLSPSMINTEKEQLVEVGRYMITYNPNFAPENNATRHEYTYQLLRHTLEYFQLDRFQENVLQTLVFDALIGNSDRHQENWAFIYDSFLDDVDIDFTPLTERLTSEFTGKVIRNVIANERELRKLNIKKFAPIYDSGSSLGRELTEERIGKMLNNPQMIDAYINRGTSELHWGDKKKKPHLELLQLIKKEEGTTTLGKAADFLKGWQGELVHDIVHQIDQVLPPVHGFYKLSSIRKELIFKLLTLRFERITNIIYG